MSLSVFIALSGGTNFLQSIMTLVHHPIVFLSYTFTHRKVNDVSHKIHAI